MIEWSSSVTVRCAYHDERAPGRVTWRDTALVGQHHMMDTTRVDRFAWAVRLYATRSAATTACQGGHVEVNGRGAKPATPVRVGDRIEATVGDRVRVLEVVRIIDKRVGAAVAAECVIDHSPPPPERDREPAPFAREHGTGRPTKRERRQLDRFRQR